MGKRYKNALCWLRRDLRISDNTALAKACNESSSVAVCFVFDSVILDALDDHSDRRVSFIYQSLLELETHLKEVGSELIVLHGDPTVEIPALAEKLGVEAVFTARDWESYARKRDESVEKKLKSSQVDFHRVKDHVIKMGPEVVTSNKEPFRVFTPYKNEWRKRLTKADLMERSADLSALAPSEVIGKHTQQYGLDKIGFKESRLWLEPGENAANRRLDEFMSKINDYGKQRDVPSAHGTSGLSVHFRFGTLSIRAAARAAVERDTQGAQKWLDELIWREFYQAILYFFPHVETKPFRSEYDGLEWPGTKEYFERWKEGQTGYPIVDAAMRHFNQTGWMHNRLRMVVASFLTKDLLVDYRWGEAYFAANLLDFDLASNNGGWQWAASTGVDSQPYFRIFNPVLQSAKFDPEGVFIRKACPELTGLSNKEIHAPWETSMFLLDEAGIKLGSDYPMPIVDHKTQRTKAIQLLSLKKNS